jgi:hypothetical protein
MVGKVATKININKINQLTQVLGYKYKFVYMAVTNYAWNYTLHNSKHISNTSKLMVKSILCKNIKGLYVTRTDFARAVALANTSKEIFNSGILPQLRHLLLYMTDTLYKYRTVLKY